MLKAPGGTTRFRDEQQSCDLEEGCDVLHHRSTDQCAVVEDREHQDDGRRTETFQHLRHRDEVTQIDRKADSERGRPAGTDDKEQAPTEKKAPERRVGLAQVNVLAAGMRQHRAELGERQRAAERQQARDDPNREYPLGRRQARAISPGTMKIPEPMIVPITIALASQRPNRRVRSSVAIGPA